MAARGRSAVESNRNVERPPAQGVFGDARLVGGGRHRRARRSRRPISTVPAATIEFAGDLRRSGRLRAGVRARPALPRLEFQLSDRHDQRRGVLAQEQRAGAHPGQLLRLRRARRRRGRAAQRRGRNLDRPLRRRLPQFRSERRARATTPARPPAPPTTNAAPGPMRGRAMSAGGALLPERKTSSRRGARRGLSPAWCGDGGHACALPTLRIPSRMGLLTAPR